jgi:hypothetical protein
MQTRDTRDSATAGRAVYEECGALYNVTEGEFLALPPKKRVQWVAECAMIFFITCAKSRSRFRGDILKKKITSSHV